MQSCIYTKDFVEQRRPFYVRALAVSLGLHILVVTVILLSVNFKGSENRDSNNSERAQVKSYVIFTPQMITNETERLSRDDRPALTSDAEQITSNTQTNDAAPEKESILDKPDNSDKVETFADATVVQTVKTKRDSPIENTKLELSNKLQTPQRGPSSKSITTMTSNSLKSLNRIRDQKVAEQAGKDYQRSLVSPTINTESTINTLVWEPERPQHKISCDNLASKALALTTSISGGTISCEDNSQFKQYIDARLNKQTLGLKEN